MRTCHLLTLVVVFTASACGSSKSPWARKMPKTERVAWPTKCGIPADMTEARDGRGDYANTMYSGHFDAPPPTNVRIACELTWNRDKDRLAHLRVHIARFDPALAAADVEPLLMLALAELRPEDQAVARRVAAGEYAHESSGALAIQGGFSREHRIWELLIRAK